ncbi:hypothetical protein [Christensenella tenuis]|jgi:ABC-type oligopeptide transport system substrate-binding subunit|uniref:DUF4352 domain-containing protein n=1 Tax=Christensenella tenuis TaxID=2763033 RepID=A0ABR7ED06_9FIRM|nr:hypothetical protein [Christensenella tenuis]MBC5647662.1 hypothetical protein [Christensenella tenuis]
MKKLISIICTLLVLTLILCACSPAVTFQTSGAGYEVVAVETGEQALSRTAESGNTLLTILLKTSDSNLDDAQNSFMPVDGEPCYVTDGGEQYPCATLAFESNGSDVQAVLLFEVPSDWSSGGKEFSLGGGAFSPVALKK